MCITSFEGGCQHSGVKMFFEQMSDDVITTLSANLFHSLSFKEDCSSILFASHIKYKLCTAIIFGRRMSTSCQSYAIRDLCIAGGMYVIKRTVPTV